MENFDVEVLAGIPFMEFNDIAVRLALRAFIIRGTLYQCRSSETKAPHEAVQRCCSLSSPDFYYHLAQRVSPRSTSLVFQISQSIETQRIILSSQPRLHYSRQQQTQKEHTRSSSVSLDPENRLHVDDSVKFRATLNQFDYVFNPKIEGCNGASGPF